MSQASAHVYAGIRGLISEGVFSGGDQMREAALAERLGVSRTPVREALRRLEAEGIIERRGNRRSYLVEILPRDMEEIFLVRAALEPLAAQLAAARADDAFVDRLRDLADRMDAALTSSPVDYDGLARSNSAFHGEILAASDNRTLAEAIRAVTRRPLVTLTFRRYSAVELRRSQAHHREMISAFDARDPEWAWSVMRAHILAARSVNEPSSIDG
jgi:DNA-binding GntR family transcriptional regulator